MASQKLGRVRAGSARTDPAGDSVRFGHHREVEWRLKGKKFALKNGQLVEIKDEE